MTNFVTRVDSEQSVRQWGDFAINYKYRAHATQLQERQELVAEYLVLVDTDCSRICR